jgi:hypothetical protein
LCLPFGVGIAPAIDSFVLTQACTDNAPNPAVRVKWELPARLSGFVRVRGCRRIWHPGDAERFHNNANVYNRWHGNTVVARAPRPTSTPSIARQGQSRDLYAGRNGQVWDHRQNGWFHQDNHGRWSRSAPEEGIERQRQSRSLGESRTNEFRGFRPRVGGGMPRILSPGFGGSRGGGRR